MMSRRTTDVRQSGLARIAELLGVYPLYRLYLVRRGYRNPFVCVLKVTSRCNLNCTHCAWEKHYPDMPIDAIKGHVDRSYNLGCEAVVLEGGEPTLREDLTEIIDYVHRKKMLVILITNGTNPIAGYGADAWWVSIEGDREDHEKIRGSGTYERVLRNIGAVTAKRVIILMTISRTNISSVEKLPALFPDRYIWYNFMYPYKGSRDGALDREQAILTARRIISLKKRFPTIINSSSYLSGVGRQKCCYDWWTYTMSYNGTANIGCTVAQLEEQECERCWLACNAEPFHALRLKMDALRCIKLVAGVKSILDLHRR